MEIDIVNFKIYAFCTVVLFYKMFAIGIVQGKIRKKNKHFVIPEDAKIFGKVGPKSQEHPDITRANNAYRNDLENIPIFLILGLIYILLNCNPIFSMYAFPIYTLSRIMHTYFYIHALQPWRTISYIIAQTIAFIFSLYIIHSIIFK